MDEITRLKDELARTKEAMHHYKSLYEAAREQVRFLNDAAEKANRLRWQAERKTS